MLVDLAPYADTDAGAIRRISVEVSRPSPSSLRLRYELTGDIGQLVVPAWLSRSRADELWRTTCFEAFVGGADGAYFEFNLSPSGQWAAYRFDGYRTGMTAQDGVEVSALETTTDAGSLTLSAELRLDRLGLGDGLWQLNLSAVVEDRAGGKTYWALAHPSDKPDFHHPESFVLELP
jgi:hypothetical protein